jgi:hypothetical protein
LETASIPVMDVAPEAKARRMSSGPRTATAVMWGGGTVVKPRSAALTKPPTMSAAMASRNR